MINSSRANHPTVDRPQIVLASHSPFRIELMNRLGLQFVAVPHHCDEDAVKTPDIHFEEAARTLARLKAESLAAQYPKALIIGSDQIAEIDGTILGKPGDETTAVAQLQRLNGRTHRLITALALVFADHSQPVQTTVVVNTLQMRELSDDEIRDYVRRDRPLNCAGSYRIERLGIALFESIEGNDFTAIIGLPLLSLVSMLTEAGMPVLGLRGAKEHRSR